MFITAFGESFAFLSLLFPGTTLLIAAGALIKSRQSFALADPDRRDPRRGARRFGLVLDRPAASAPGWPGYGRSSGIRAAAGGMRFFERHGGKSVFIGRFFGPVRAVVPLAAGIMRMPPRPVLAGQCDLGAGLGADAAAGRRRGRRSRRAGSIGSANTVLLAFGGMTLFGIVAALWAALRAARPKG